MSILSYIVFADLWTFNLSVTNNTRWSKKNAFQTRLLINKFLYLANVGKAGLYERQKYRTSQNHFFWCVKTCASC